MEMIDTSSYQFENTKDESMMIDTIVSNET